VSQVFLKSGRVQPVWAGHPWVFPQGIAKVKGNPEHGDEVEVHDAKGNALGRGLYSKDSAIAVRIYSRNAQQRLDSSFIEKRLRAALDRRKLWGLGADPATNSYRAFHSEGDELPGLIVDKFSDCLVIQLGTAGMAQHRDVIVDALAAVYEPRAIIERTSAKIAEREKFEAKTGVIWGEDVEEIVAVERGITYRLPWGLDQKTGFYFDQRPLRDRIEALSAGKTVLDTYCYVGPIGLAARRGGASRVVCVDSSEKALNAGSRIAKENNLDITFEKAKALNYLEEEKESWDLVVADPPKLAQSRAGRDRAMKAFRRIAGASVRATKRGGIVVVSSCSSAIAMPEVERCLALGARDVQRRVTVMERVFQGPDHPVTPAFPEGLYLSTLIAHVQ